MASLLTRARRVPRDGPLRAIDNPRARLTGPLCLLGGLVFVASAFEAPDGGAAVAYAALAAVLLAMGWRFSAAFTMVIEPNALRLRNGLSTRDISLADIVECRPCVTSRGLMYSAAVPEVVLADGSSVLFNGIQWPPDNEAGARDDCNALMKAIRIARD